MAAPATGGTDLSERLYFDAVEEHRGSYFVTYHPPVGDAQFATLHLTFLDSVSESDASASVASEFERWMNRYPVPLMVFASDAAERDNYPESDPRATCLVGWRESMSGQLTTSRKLDDLDQHLRSQAGTLNLRDIYADIPVRTDDDVKQNANRFAMERRSQVRTLRATLFLWLAVIPAIIAIFEFFAPAWLGLILLVIALLKAYDTALELWGISRPTPSSRAAADRKRKMDHYFYHCERNPSAFARLRAENFASDLEAKTRSLADGLKRVS